MKGLGKGVKSFKDGMNDVENTLKDNDTANNKADKSIENKKWFVACEAR